MAQNYFQHNNHFYKQKEGLATGAPSSSILSEIYLQFLEHNEILNILSDLRIVSYSRYVDDILLLYNYTNTNIEQVSNAFNNINNNIQFTIEKENNKKINFLDITVHRLHSKLEYNIYLKPTSNSTIIHNAFHPVEHKTMAFDFIFNRLNAYPLNKTNKNLEIQITNQIARENNYHPNNTAIRTNTNIKPNLITVHKTQDIPSNSLENNKNGKFLHMWENKLDT
jgi:hypothetical protein